MKLKNFGLALWGWAARWFAHIWVIKYLEEKSLIPSEVAWTSMWAIIAACVACWFDSAKIIWIIKEVDFFKLIDFDFKKWLIKWDKIKKKFKDIFWETTFDQTKIPLKIIATDICSWKKVIFKSWSLVDALRASVSIPWVIAPYHLDDTDYIDWGIVNNLPIEVLDSEVVLAVSVLRNISRPIKESTSLFNIDFKKTFIWINYQILQKTIDIMMSQNEERSLSTKWKNIIHIHPEFEGIDYYEFHKSKEIVEIWYLEASKCL